MYLPTVMMLALNEKRRLDCERRGASERRRLVSSWQPRPWLGFARWARPAGAPGRLEGAGGARS